MRQLSFLDCFYDCAALLNISALSRFFHRCVKLRAENVFCFLQDDKVETEEKDYQVSETAIKDKSLLGTHAQKLCENIDVYWMTPTCAADSNERKSSRCILVSVCILHFYQRGRIPSFQLGTVTLAGWLIVSKLCLSVRAINRSTSTNGALRYQLPHLLFTIVIHRTFAIRVDSVPS